MPTSDTFDRTDFNKWDNSIMGVGYNKFFDLDDNSSCPASSDHGSIFASPPNE